MTRKLKVEENRTATRSGQSGTKLRLKGRWLEALGFVAGSTVTVQAVPGGLLVLNGGGVR